MMGPVEVVEVGPLDFTVDSVGPVRLSARQVEGDRRRARSRGQRGSALEVRALDPARALVGPSRSLFRRLSTSELRTGAAIREPIAAIDDLEPGGHAGRTGDPMRAFYISSSVGGW